MKFKTTVRFCEYCGGAGMDCPECEGGIIEDIVIIKNDEPQQEERLCNCGSGVHWAFCPENSPYCG